MSVSPGTLAIVSAVLGLFLGGAVAGIGLAWAFAPGSWVAETVSFFALPLAFAAGLQAWYGLALFSLIPRILRGLGGSHSGPARGRETRPLQLPGSFVFLPLSSGAAAVAGMVVGWVSSTDRVWFVVLVYWLVGTAHGLLAWRLARGGVLLPPESV